MVGLICLTLMAHPSYGVREAGECGLKLWDCESSIRAGMRSPSCEVRNRCQNVLAKWQERQVAKMKPLPRIDSAWYTVAKGYDWNKKEFEGWSVPDMRKMLSYPPMKGGREKYDHYRHATALWVGWCLRTGEPLADVRRKVLVMRDRERESERNRGKRKRRK